jgi:hypothetical protein
MLTYLCNPAFGGLLMEALGAGKGAKKRRSGNFKHAFRSDIATFSPTLPHDNDPRNKLPFARPNGFLPG